MMIENVKTYATLKNLYVLYLYTIVFDGTVLIYTSWQWKVCLSWQQKECYFQSKKAHKIFLYIGKENNIAACILQISSVGIQVRYVFM